MSGFAGASRLYGQVLLLWHAPRAGGSGVTISLGTETMIKTFAILAVATASLAAGAAQAAQQWPASIVGNWSALSNQTSLTFSITSQTGGETCNQIAGTIGSDTLLGFYCPGSGRFNFLRSNSPSGTYQAYTGNLSETVFGNVVMTGSFVDYIDDPEGEYNFLASPAE
jgi:hypothetical protein